MQASGITASTHLNPSTIILRGFDGSKCHTLFLLDSYSSEDGLSAAGIKYDLHFVHPGSSAI
jgi:hypothetical protein